MGLPLVSILIPVYQRQDLVEACVESALGQTYPNVEVVIADNHSTDHTWEICERLARADPRIRVFRNSSNLGPVENWKLAIQAARGSLAMLLFSDDLLHPRFVDETLPLLGPTTAFVFSSVVVGAHPFEGPILRWRTQRGTFSSSTFLRDALADRGTPASPGCALFRSADLRDYLLSAVPGQREGGGAGTGAGPDLLLLLLTAAAHEGVGFVPEPLVFFRSHRGSISIARAEEVKDGYLQARIWFAKRQGWRAWQARLVGRRWLRELRHGRWVLPRAVVARYGADCGVAEALLGAVADVADRLVHGSTGWMHRRPSGGGAW